MKREAAVLARCLEGVNRDGLAQAFAHYEATRKPRASAIQMQSSGTRWLRGSTDPGRVYGYDAWTAAGGLAQPPKVIVPDARPGMPLGSSLKCIDGMKPLIDLRA